MQKIKNYLLIFVFTNFLSGVIYAHETYHEADNFVKKSTELSLHESPYWKLLLHYNGNRSAIKDDSFFLAKDGYKNPASELHHTILEFFRTDIPLDNNHPLCRFPARLKWIKQELQIPTNLLPKAQCLELKTYLEKTAAREVDISFASENVNNLMSMMGHIFLKISGERDDGRVEHSLGYFANYSAANPVLFLVGAVSYGAPGVYILEPYDKKLDQYNNQQKRSIWEYKLNFIQDQVDNLVLHIWEMRHANAKYNFITHNCGSALLYLLYIADPNLQKLYDPLDAPLDIIKKLERNHYVKNINLVPSDSYKFRMIASNFSADDRSLMTEFLKDGDVRYFNKYSSQKKSNIAYGTRTAMDYKLVNGDLKKEKYDLLNNKIRDFSKSLPQNNLIYNVKNPLKKSDSSRLTLGYKNQGHDKSLVNFGFYPVYNSISGNNSEYFNEVDLQLMNLEGGYYTDRNKVRLDNFDLIKIKNLVSYDSFVNGLSGSFKVNMERERFDTKSNKMFPNTAFGVGIGEGVFNNKVLFYSMANFGYSYFQSRNVTYANPEIGAIFKEGKFGKINTKYTKYFSSNRYKYKDILSIEQTFFLLENHDVLMSYKKTSSGLEKDFRTIALEYQFHF